MSLDRSRHLLTSHHVLESLFRTASNDLQFELVKGVRMVEVRWKGEERRRGGEGHEGRR
jgi:hypothetical protein